MFSLFATLVILLLILLLLLMMKKKKQRQLSSQKPSQGTPKPGNEEPKNSDNDSTQPSGQEDSDSDSDDNANDNDNPKEKPLDQDNDGNSNPDKPEQEDGISASIPKLSQIAKGHGAASARVSGVKPSELGSGGKSVNGKGTSNQNIGRTVITSRDLKRKNRWFLLIRIRSKKYYMVIGL